MKKHILILLSLGVSLLFTSCKANTGSSTPSVAPSVSAKPDSAVSSAPSSSSSITTDRNSSVTSSVQKPSSNSSSSQPLQLKPCWSSLNMNTYGNQFRGQLQKLINQTGNRTISYSTNNSVLAISDKALNGKNGIIPFYHDENAATTDWNKEHVWPRSRGVGKSGAGADPHMLRPTYTDDNSSRSNNFYGIPGSDGSKTYDPACLGYEPARGESARIIFYVATRYYGQCFLGTKGLELSNNPNDLASENTMGRLDRLIEWNRKYPVTDQEKRRNDSLEEQGFGRNPFIDHPELVEYIWNSQGLRTSSDDTENPIEPEPPVSYENTYDVIQDLKTLEQYTEVSIVGKLGNDSAAMKDTPKNETRPWYLDSEPVTFKENRYLTNSTLVNFEVHKNEAGLYSFKSNGKYLYHYIDGNHYSIGMKTDIQGAENLFSVTEAEKGFSVYGADGVYLDYASGFSTFQGNKKPASEIHFVHKSANSN